MPNFACISRLICGQDFEPTNEIDEVLNHLASSLDLIVAEIAELPSLTPNKLSLYGPYLGRSLLELSTTAILARLDPFKILIMKGNQLQPDYDIARPHASSIRWQGDVVDEHVDKLWTDKNLKNPTRAILGAYQIELVMLKSACKLFDESNEMLIGGWYDELTKTDAKGLLERLRTKTNQLYSSLSKGIHHELLIPQSSVLDRDTVINLINDTLFVVMTLGLLISRVPHAYQKTSESDCFAYYKQAKELELI